MTMDAAALQSLEAELTSLSDRCPFPRGLRAATAAFTDQILGLAFPHFADSALPIRLENLARQLDQLIGLVLEHARDGGRPNLDSFWQGLPSCVRKLRTDAEAMHFGDPASSSVDEVILTYPGFYAIAVYRFAHELLLLDVPLLPRLMTEDAHRRTGVDIHPSATIGHSFAIDHGTGVVIGGTAIVGNGVKLYQGVTLGATSVERSLANTKRHPTVEDNVVIYANATLLGGKTVIGHDSVIGGSAWITHSVPPFSVVGRDTEVRPRTNRNPDLEFQI